MRLYLDKNGTRITEGSMVQVRDDIVREVVTSMDANGREILGIVESNNKGFCALSEYSNVASLGGVVQFKYIVVVEQ